MLKHLLNFVKREAEKSAIDQTKNKAEKTKSSLAEVVAETTIEFNVQRRADDTYTVEVRSFPTEDEDKLNAYATWLAGSIVRSMKKFHEEVP